MLWRNSSFYKLDFFFFFFFMKCLLQASNNHYWHRSVCLCGFYVDSVLCLWEGLYIIMSLLMPTYYTPTNTRVAGVIILLLRPDNALFQFGFGVIKSNWFLIIGTAMSYAGVVIQLLSLMISYIIFKFGGSKSNWFLLIGAGMGWSSDGGILLLHEVVFSCW